MFGKQRGWLAALAVLSAATLMFGSAPAGAKPAAPPEPTVKVKPPAPPSPKIPPAPPTPKVPPAPPAPPAPKVKVGHLTVLDGDGNAFPGEAGVVYCAGTDPCQASTTDQRGAVAPFVVDPNVQYHVFSFATNTGWPCGGYPLNDKLWWFGTGTDGPGRSLARPATFVVTRPDCPLQFHIVNADDNHQPFALGHAGMWACPVVNCVTADGPDKNIVFAGADAEGDLTMSGLDPAVEYSFVFYAIDIDGWSCPSFSYQGVDYWTAPDVIGVPSAVDGHTASISDNECSARPTTTNAVRGSAFGSAPDARGARVASRAQA